MSRCTKAVIYKENLIYNLKQIKKIVGPNKKICVAVKADSYGHNAILTSKLAEKLKYDYLAVATVGEGIELRKAGIKLDILLLSLAVPEEFNEIFEYKITPVIFGEDYIQLLSVEADSYFGRKKKFHNVFLAVDTGMGRVGCYENEAAQEAQLINDSKHLKLTGMITHLCVSDSIKPENQEFTKTQIEIFSKAIENVKSAGIDPGICSCGASAGLLCYDNMNFEMVRPGIITYGYYPDEITKEYLKSQNKDFDIKPVMALETKVVAIRKFTKGQTISYGRTYTCEEDTDIAVLPIGYADGLLRRFSPGLKVTINGNDYPVCGRICMDQCMVKLGKNHDVKVFDKVLIFGPKESGANNTADTLANLGKTISYEVLTSITKRVKREIQ